MEIILPVFVGLVVGFLIGLTGMGGGALMTPFLLIVMKLDPVLAVGTDLTFAAIIKVVGSIQHRREKNVSLRQKGNSALTENILPTILGVTLIIVSLIILARVFRWLGPKEHIEIIWPEPWSLILIGIIGGLLVGMTSIGGGTVIMALLLIFFSIPLNLMVGIDVVHGALLTIVTSVNYIFAGQADWGLVGLLLIGSLPGAWLGALAINRIDVRIVRGILALVVIGAGIDLLIK